ncbi:Spc98 family-domain-containing protein [Aspergillus alliaceus]|uniref:Spindle pole body component n=1 Tax=Petromyces alliaceus TaxID=209559 RepID=A0A5N6FRM3_PETAA|nr:Spc98 family-domain-containing protein [Aspergillus alliaceus]KAB8232651.1 Spc98 family-domain-containing protein [Aspergillus alliaceus]KAE8394906.1 Spc98 family-domain-containing protein [Aspergillus alliaceus]
MDLEDYDADPFSSKGLWRLSKFTLQSLQPLEPLPWNEELPDLTGGIFKIPLDLFNEDNSKVHQLNFETDVFDRDLIPETSTYASSETQAELTIIHPETEDVVEDIWMLDSLDDEPGNKGLLKTWETYQNRSYREPASAYFSESGARGFDATLAHQDLVNRPGNPSRVARNDIFFQSLFRLGLGWSSMFFRYNREHQMFERVFDDVRLSGVSVAALKGLTDEMIRCGTNMQRVRNFVGKAPSKSTKLSAISTLSSAMAVIIYTLEKQLLKYSKNIASLIQISALFQRCGELVGSLADLVEAIKGVVSEAQIFSIVFEKAAHFSQTFGQMEDLFREIVIRTVIPFLEHVEAWIGLRSEAEILREPATSGRSFMALEFSEENSKTTSSQTTRFDYRYNSAEMPSFIPQDQAQLIFESGRSLRLLKRFHPQHPIASNKICNGSIPRLSCASTWADIERIQQKAQKYENQLRSEILKYNRGDASAKENIKLGSQAPAQAGASDTLKDTFDLFDIDDAKYMTGLLANQTSMEKDELSRLLDSRNDTYHEMPEDSRHNFGPELASALYLSLAPLLSSQALLIDFSCLHLLFKEHKVRYHLSLQWRFQLLGDGFFTSRLSHALFDPEMQSGERKPGVVRSSVHTGLRLGSRDTWPPASSELRLVLIGLLSECHGFDDHSENLTGDESRKERELPGGLSFSIRELTDDEITKCKDPNAIEALDFLRLQYKPSNVLEAIITPRSLNKYDRLFKHLLRLLRMVSVVKGLIRDSTGRDSLSGDPRNVYQKFRIDCQHFVLALSDYCFHVGVGSTWQRFQDSLSKIEYCLDRGDIDGTIEAAHSVPRLRDYHEDILDQILFALFLSKRHADAAKLVESIFDTILTFAPLSRMDGTSGVRYESEAIAYQLYANFRKQTSLFVGYLRSLDGVKAASKSFGRSGSTFASREAPTSIFEHLLARLDMKKYY